MLFHWLPTLVKQLPCGAVPLSALTDSANAAALRFQIEEVLHDLTQPATRGERDPNALVAAVAVAVIVVAIAVTVWALI